MFREKLGYLEGGSNTLLIAMKSAIESGGGELRLSSPVSRVVMDAGRVKGVQVGSNFEAFERVISTIPLPYVPGIMPDLPEDILSKFRSVQSIAIVCVIVKLRRPVSENFWVNVNDPAMDIPGIVEFTNLCPLDRHIVYVPFYMPKEHPKFLEPDQVFIDKVRAYLKRLNSSITDADIIDIRASRYRFAQPICPPNYLASLPPVELPVSRLLVADTSYYYPEDRGISESVEFGRMLARKAVQN